MRSLYALLTFFLLTGCGGTLSQIGYRDSHLSIRMDEAVTQLHAVPLAQRTDNYKSLFIYQHILKLDEGNLVVYEDAKTDLQYEFEPTMMRIVDVVFETRKKVLVYSRDHLRAYQMILSGDKILNLIVQQSESQELQLLYGMTTPQLNRILKSLDPAAPKAYYTSVITIHHPKEAIQTHWDVKKVHFYPLVVPLPRFVGF